MKDDKNYLRHILDFCARIQEYSKGGRAEFLASQLIQDAIVRNIETIGEAVKNISPELKALHPEVPWKSIARMRDRIIHHYFGLMYDLIWDVVEKDIPELEAAIKAILKGLDSAAPSTATPPSSPPQK